LEYTPGVSHDLAEQILRLHDKINRKGDLPDSHQMKQSIDIAEQSSSDALVPIQRQSQTRDSLSDHLSHLSAPAIFKTSDLFAAAPPADLPPFPPPQSTALVKPGLINGHGMSHSYDSNYNEAVTYHPLLTEAVHSMLLCHALLQTPPKELRRHAYNAARLVRLLSGYPIFLHARSTSRADWAEILRRTNNWLDLSRSWSDLCQPVSSGAQVYDDSGGGNGTSQNGNAKPDLSSKQKKEKVLHEAILEALADERVVDEESFHRAVRAREMEQHGEEPDTADSTCDDPPTPPPEPEVEEISTSDISKVPTETKWTPDSPKDYPGLSTERAEAITRWIKDAPLSVEGAKSKKNGKKKSKKKATTEEEFDDVGIAE
jgi:hypothetical protein